MSNTPEPSPNPTQGPAIWDLVIADMQERDRIGTAKYGQRLGAGDGRDSLIDAYQEALDLAVYLKKAIVERDTLGQGAGHRAAAGKADVLGASPQAQEPK